MRQHNRQYTYRLTTRGIDYVTNRAPSLNTSVPQPYGQDWSIRRRHDTKTAPRQLFVAGVSAATSCHTPTHSLPNGVERLISNPYEEE